MAVLRFDEAKEARMRGFFESLSEKDQRRFAALQADQLGHGGIASVAWSLKAWSTLWLPESGRWKDRRHREKFKLLKMEFRAFVNTIIRIPCQILTTGRRTV